MQIVFVISEQSELIVFDPVQQGEEQHLNFSISQLKISMNETEESEEKLLCFELKE